MVKKYKIVYGFEPDNYIPIEEDELEKATYAHMIGGKAMFRAGSADFSRSGIFVQPDFNAAMGWHRGYKPMSDDFAEIEQNGIDRELTRFQAHVKERVEYLKANGQENLIGKNVPIPELDQPNEEKRGGGIKRIGDII